MGLAEGLVRSLEREVPEVGVRSHAVRFGKHLTDVHVTADDWALTISVASDFPSVRLLLDDYVIERLNVEDVIAFVKSLRDKAASVRIVRPMFGAKAHLTVRMPDNSITVDRPLKEGLAGWERALIDE